MISGQQTGIDLSHLGRVQPLSLREWSILYDDQSVVPKFKPSTTCLSDARLSASTVAIHQHKVSTWSPQHEQLAIFVNTLRPNSIQFQPNPYKPQLKTLFNSRFISDQRFLSIGGQRCPNVFVSLLLLLVFDLPVGSRRTRRRKRRWPSSLGALGQVRRPLARRSH